MALGDRLVERVDGADADLGGRRGGLDQGPQRLRSQVAYGTVDRLVDDVRLDELSRSAVVRQIRQTFVSWWVRNRRRYASPTLPDIHSHLEANDL